MHHLDIDALAARFTSGEPVRVIAADLGVNPITVRRRLVLLGLTKVRWRTPQSRLVGEDGLKSCSGPCGQRLPVEAFHKVDARPSGRNDMCRECWRGYSRERRLMREFGISSKIFDQMVQAQGGGCAVCGTPVGSMRNGKPLRLAVDHDHHTGAVRGILCSNCNNGLGRFKDDPDLLRRAAEYIDDSKE